MMSCKKCEERGKTWKGDNPICAFNSEAFSDENWNCATMNELRCLCYKSENVVYNEDQNACILAIPDSCQHLALSWYKSRGKTEGAWIIKSDCTPPEPLTLAIAENILAR